MRTTHWLPSLIAFSMMLAHMPLQAADATDFWQTPATPGFGRMHPIPNAAYVPDKAATYKVVFELTLMSQDGHSTSPSLERLARTVNLYVASGVPLDHLKFVAVADGAAGAMLNDEQYTKYFGVKNPNLPLIATLRKTGVDVAVCGQAFAEHGYDTAWADSSVTVALSALTTITMLEQQGYAFMRL
jgi:intracellular sulfur oxidation DsrE/DsrF family protein